jgi:hypothetical protein
VDGRLVAWCTGATSPIVTLQPRRRPPSVELAGKFGRGPPRTSTLGAAAGLRSAPPWIATVRILDRRADALTGQLDDEPIGLAVGRHQGARHGCSRRADSSWSDTSVRVAPSRATRHHVATSRHSGRPHIQAPARISADARPRHWCTVDRPAVPPVRASTSHSAPSVRMNTSRRPRWPE